MTDGLTGALPALFDAIGTPVLDFVLINTSYLVLIALSSVEFARHLRRARFAGLEEAATSPLTQPVSVLVPAHNEQAGIVSAVQAMLSLRYPEHEVVVIDNGSQDSTFDRLQTEFDLVEVRRVTPKDVPVRKDPSSVHMPADGRTPLVVVRKENSGRSDSLNVGINIARYPLVAMVDADSILDPDALLVVAKPFADDPRRTVATAGVIRAVRWLQGHRRPCRRRADAATHARPHSGGRVPARVPLGCTGWSRLRSLIIISTSFRLFRRDVLVSVGGLDPDCIGEDFELVMRAHRHMRRQKCDYAITFVAEPVSWTEVPSSERVLGNQRRRWHRGLWEVLWRYRGMLLNPRYGRIGMLALPYYWLFELMAPLVQLVGLILVPLGLLTGVVDASYAIRFLLVAYGFALLVSLAALCVEELSFHRYSRWRDLLAVLVAGDAENVGYRQLTVWWRLRGLAQGLTNRRPVSGAMTREGFDEGESR